MADEQPKLDNQEESQTVTVGDKSYTQEQLSRLVGLGEIAVEAEEKYNRPIDKFWPEYTQTKQRVLELEQENQTLKTSSTQAQAQVEDKLEQAGLTDEQKAVARQQLKAILGDEVVTKGEFEKEVNRRVQEVIGADKLIQETEQVVSSQAEQGHPTTSVTELLNYMQTEGVKNPQKAYKLMFEEELDRIKESKLNSIKPKGLVTDSGSTAGSKQPQPQPIHTKEQLRSALKSHFNAQG